MTSEFVQRALDTSAALRRSAAQMQAEASAMSRTATQSLAETLAQRGRIDLLRTRINRKK